MSIRLNIGAGGSQLPGFTPIDATLGHDCRRLDYADGSVDEVYASHVLEHLHHTHTWTAIREWCRVLKPGGRIRIAVPDFPRLLEDFRNDKIGLELFAAFIHGSYDDDLDRHRAVLTRERMVLMLESCGIEAVRDFVPEYADCSRIHYSMNLDGVKRHTLIPRDPKVTMLVSRPRVGFMNFADCSLNAAQKLGWKHLPKGGTEWAKGMELGCAEILAKTDTDYIFCLDYDSLFRPEDCAAMLAFMQSRPDVGAAWPVQAHRHMDTTLGFAPGFEQNYDFSGEFTEMGSGHFGCTIIRRSILETVERPWFASLPSPEKGFDESVDADVTFWIGARMKGWKVGQLNTVQIGHGIEAVKWVGEKGVIIQPMSHYERKGAPSRLAGNGEFLKAKHAKTMIESGHVLVRLPAGLGNPCVDRDGCIKGWVLKSQAEESGLEIILPAPTPARVPPEGSPELMPQKSHTLADDGA